MDDDDHYDLFLRLRADPTFLASVARDPRQALAPFHLTVAELRQVADLVADAPDPDAPDPDVDGPGVDGIAHSVRRRIRRAAFFEVLLPIPQASLAPPSLLK